MASLYDPDFYAWTQPHPGHKVYPYLLRGVEIEHRVTVAVGEMGVDLSQDV